MINHFTNDLIETTKNHPHVTDEEIIQDVTQRMTPDTSNKLKSNVDYAQLSPTVIVGSFLSWFTIFLTSTNMLKMEFSEFHF